MAIAPKTPRQARKRLTSGIRNLTVGSALVVSALLIWLVESTSGVLLFIGLPGFFAAAYGIAELESWRRFEDRRDTTEADLLAGTVAHATS